MRSVFTHILQKAFSRSADAFLPGRRVFVRNSAMAAAALTLPLGGCSWLGGQTSVAIVGAGIAGMTAAHELNKLGVRSTIFEATGRAGGRVLTIDDAVVDGAYVDFGPEYVDTTHQDLIELCRELGVELTDLRKDVLTPKCYYIQDKKFTEEDLVDALQPFAGRIRRDVESLPAELHYSKADQFRALDNLTVAEYLKELGIDGWLYGFFDVSMKSEYAMEIEEQSAVNLLTILALPVAYDAHYHVYGREHEVMKVKGGTQRLIERLQAKVANQIKTGWELKKIHRSGSETELFFLTANGMESVVAEQIILALPITVLRSVEMNFKFPDRKQQWIQTAGFGNASKVAMGFDRRVWRDQGYQGYTFTDINEMAIWDSSEGVEISSGSLTFVTAGKESVAVESLNYPDIERILLSGAERVFSGLQEHYNHRISKFCWTPYPYSKGSYTSYKRGQWSSFAGVEQESFENIHFAGEHCSVKHQGFMNGAVESAKRAALEIVAPPPLASPGKHNYPHKS